MTPIHRSRLWRSGASHFVVFIVGVALATTLAPRANLFRASVLASPLPAASSEFHRALQSVMVQMDAGMCITPSADTDRDFARAMIPHHQGAIEMAKLELVYGSDARLRRLAQGLVVEQAQEIALMRSVLADPATGLARISTHEEGGRP
jgi:hypothetical protein